MGLISYFNNLRKTVMNKKKYSIALVALLALFVNCFGSTIIYESERLKIISLTEHTFVHVSYLDTESYGKVSCNGLVFITGTEAIVFDTPTSDPASNELINWIKESNHKIKMVIVSHSHEDCLWGLKAFHEVGILSMANNLTLQIANELNTTVPTNGFTDRIINKINGVNVISVFPGEGHTHDNIISYIPTEQVLFGGCLIKALDANEGYTGEANIKEWSNTVSNIKAIIS